QLRISHRDCHSSILNVSARRRGSMFALVSIAAASLGAICKPAESELRSVLRFWPNPALISLKNKSSSSVLIYGVGYISIVNTAKSTLGTGKKDSADILAVRFGLP